VHVQTCSGRNRTIPLMRRPNNDSTPNTPVKLRRKQILINYVIVIPVHTVMIWSYGTGKRYGVYGVTVSGNVTLRTVLRYVLTLDGVRFYGTW
jgi:hypothetical protein